jgi:type II secretory pathway pseudopilin PulG
MAYWMSSHARQVLSGEAGFALIEVVVSALIVVMTTGAVFTLLNASGKAGAEERNKAQAYALAQEDQGRLRAMRIPDLLASVKTAPREVRVGTTKYTIHSTASFLNNNSGVEPACEAGNSSSDYLEIGSEVTWAKETAQQPVKILSTINPPNGSLDPSRGSLTVFVLNAQETPISGVGLSGTGAGTFTGTTNSKGCAQFSELPKGNYEMRTSLAGGFVDENGSPPGNRKVAVIGAASNTVTLLYDVPGVLKANFLVGEGSTAGKAEGMVLVNNGMQVQAETIWATNKVPAGPLEAKSLFPFKTPYAVYAGGCRKSIPEGDPTIASAAISAGKTTTVNVRLPVLNLSVNNGTSTVENVTLKLHDTECPESPTRTFSLTKGTITEGLPWAKYEFCVSAGISEPKSGGGTQTVTRRAKTTAEIKSLQGTTVPIQLTKASEAGSC